MQTPNSPEGDGIRTEELPHAVVTKKDIQAGTPGEGRRRPVFTILVVLAVAAAGGAWFLLGGKGGMPSIAASRTPPPAALASGVHALGRLVPDGEVISVAPQSGVRDARVSSLNVEVGSRVKAGDIVAVLDNEARLQAAVVRARADVDVQKARLEMVRADMTSRAEESKAALERAKATAQRTEIEFKRAATLVERKVMSESEHDSRRAANLEAIAQVAEMQAQADRYLRGPVETLPDILVAERELDAARAVLAQAEADAEQAYIRAPLNGAVIEIHARPGETPGTKGLADIGDIDNMTATIEVYEDDLKAVVVGQRVELRSPALADALIGNVHRIGLYIMTQTVIDSDPAANTDARVAKVEVTLEPASARKAANFTNLEVQALIQTGAAK